MMSFRSFLVFVLLNINFMYVIASHHSNVRALKSLGLIKSRKPCNNNYKKTNNYNHYSTHYSSIRHSETRFFSFIGNIVIGVVGFIGIYLAFCTIFEAIICSVKGIKNIYIKYIQKKND